MGPTSAIQLSSGTRRSKRSNDVLLCVSSWLLKKQKRADWRKWYSINVQPRSWPSPEQSGFQVSSPDQAEDTVLTPLTGKITAHGLVTVPALLLAREHDGLSRDAILKIWHRMYQRGHAHSPKIAAVTSSAFVYLSWCASRTTVVRAPMFLFATAAALVTGIVPFTIVLMGSTNNALIESAADEHAPLNSPMQRPDKKTSEQLLTQWATLTGIRGLLPLAGGILGLVAAFNR